jgi:hypothetical protein
MKANICVFTVIAVLGSCAAAFAGNSVSISVSCTVPAVPGMNVPLQESRQTVLIKGTDAGTTAGTMTVETFYPR